MEEHRFHLAFNPIQGQGWAFCSKSVQKASPSLYLWYSSSSRRHLPGGGKRYLQDTRGWTVVFTETVDSPRLPSPAWPLPDCRLIRPLVSDPGGFILCLSHLRTRQSRAISLMRLSSLIYNVRFILLCRVVEENSMRSCMSSAQYSVWHRKGTYSW